MEKCPRQAEFLLGMYFLADKKRLQFAANDLQFGATLKVPQYFPCGFLNTVTVNVKTWCTLRDRLCFIQTANQEKFRVFSLCPESLLRYIFGKLTAPHKNKDIVGCL